MSLPAYPFEPVQSALRRNGMVPFAVRNRDEARERTLALIPPGSVVAVGGSVTLDEIGLLPELRRDTYRFLDRYAPALTAEQLDELFGRSLTADVFVASTNALTLHGELVNKDGRGSRLAPLVYGPGKNIVVAGRNKIVADIPAGLERIAAIAAPRNSVRLRLDTPCVKTGRCMDCNSPQRICCHTVITGFQRIRDRIHVILVDEDLGY